MTRCLRITRAYSLRWMIRHSTMLFIAAFICIITLILHLYAFKHEDKYHSKRRIGDFDYKPGAFLKGRQPSENISYCEFNYGLPDALNWGTFRVYKSPESTTDYSVIYDAVRGTAFSNFSKVDALTYATQATPEFIYHIVELARFWQGPISLAVYVPDYDLYIAMQIMNHLCRCYSEMSKVSLHLFYPAQTPPKMPPKPEIKLTEAPAMQSNTSERLSFKAITQTLQEKMDKYKQLNKKERAEYIQWVRRNKIKRMMRTLSNSNRITSKLRFDDCGGLKSHKIPTYRREHRMVYPINVGRNVARNASRTNYLMVSDIELVPSEGLAPKFLSMVKNIMGDKKRNEGCIFSKTIFVVPLFEVARGEAIPRDKETLAELVADKRATYFHAHRCSHCQRFPGLQTWLMRPAPTGVEPMTIVRREYPYHRWEPIYIGTHKEPWYNEVLSWEGLQDKMAQMLELCLQQYRLIVLDGAFLCHAATSSKKSSNHPAQTHNTHWYTKIIVGLRKKYPDRPQCRVMWGY